MKTSNQHPAIILASASPRRKYLLRQAGLRFSVIPSRIDEAAVCPDSPDRYVKILAKAKAFDVSDRYPDSWVIGADTIVLIGNRILEKPGSPEEARIMLRQLSGNTHQVYTGFCICRKSRTICHCDAVKTDVVFKSLSDQAVQWYTKTKEPYDKAGGYAIQGLGTSLIETIVGSYTNVVGLPVCEVIDYLLENGALTLDELGKD